MFVDIGVVHFDLHKNNILVYYSEETRQFKVLLIDFGRASDITNEKNDRYLNEFDKSLLSMRREYFFGNPNYRILRGEEYPVSNATSFFIEYYPDWSDFYTLHNTEINELLRSEMAVTVTREKLGYNTIKTYKKSGFLFNPPPIPDEDVVDEYDEDDEELDEDIEEDEELDEDVEETSPSKKRTRQNGKYNSGPQPKKKVGLVVSGKTQNAVP